MSDGEPVVIEDDADLADRIDAEIAARLLAPKSLLDFTLLFKRDYLAGWVHRKLCGLLDDFVLGVEQKLSPRLIITFPPRHGKSLLVSRMLPAYFLGRYPRNEFISVSYNDDFATRFGREVRELLNDPVYLDLFPDLRLDTKSNALDLVRTTVGGSYSTTSVGGSLTGLGAHILSIDDPVKDRAEADSALERRKLKDWYTSVARTRLHPGGGILVTATRWHVEDLIGHLFKNSKDNPDADQWTVYEFPAIAEREEPFRHIGDPLHPERYPLKALQSLKADMLPRDWCALYQCRPYVEQGSFFHSKHFKFYTGAPPEDLNWLVAADYAVSTQTSADNTCIGALGLQHTGDIYLHPTIEYGKYDTIDSVRKTIALMKKLGARTLATEKGVIQNALEPLFKSEMEKQHYYISISRHARTAAKHVHAHAIRGRIEAGCVYFPDTEFVRTVLVPQLLQFMPEADGTDDAVDMLANGGLALESDVVKPSPPLPPAPPDAIYDENGRLAWTWERLEREAKNFNLVTNECRVTRLNGSPLEKRTKKTRLPGLR